MLTFRNVHRPLPLCVGFLRSGDPRTTARGSPSKVLRLATHDALWRRRYHVFPQPIAGTRANGPDAIDGYIEVGADFFVRATFQIAQPNDIPFFAWQFA